jgi:hypothetical protein
VKTAISTPQPRVEKGVVEALTISRILATIMPAVEAVPVKLLGGQAVQVLEALVEDPLQGLVVMEW